MNQSMNHWKDCDLCLGTGARERLVELSCHVCHGDDRIDCPVCKGFGTLRQRIEKDCNHCGGTGRSSQNNRIIHQPSRDTDTLKHDGLCNQICLSIIVAVAISMTLVGVTSNLLVISLVFLLVYFTSHTLIHLILESYQTTSKLIYVIIQLTAVASTIGVVAYSFNVVSGLPA